MIKATQAASQRTKNRVREHTDHWEHTQTRNNIVSFPGQTVAEFRCPESCGWFGWVPLNEIDYGE